MKYQKGAERPDKGPEAPESADPTNGALADPDGLLTAALALVSEGVKVFPCHRVVDDEGCTCGEPGCKSPGKHPRTKSGSKEATTDEAMIRLWWTKWGRLGRLNFGQTLAGRAVVDIDVANGKPGAASWEALSGPQSVPDTLAYRTGRGGRHIVFRLPSGEQGGKADGYGNLLAEAVDFKTGPNAYVMVPGSRTEGVYTVLQDADPAPLPEWIAEQARTAEAGTGGSVVLAGSGSQLSDLLSLPADDPYRSSNEWIAQVAGHYAGDAWKFTTPRGRTWFEDMVRAANMGSEVPHPEDRLTKTLRSIWDTEAAKHPESEADELETLTRKRVLALRSDQEARRLLRRELEQETAVESLADAWQAILDGDEGAKPTVGELADDDGGLFYEGKINGVFGDGGTGKSVALAEIQARTLNAGGTVAHWEFDNNSQRAILRRLHYAGADVGQAVKEGRIVVLRGAHELEDLAPEVVTGAALVTLDALTPAVSALGLDVNHPQGTDTALATFMQPFTVHGAAGIFIDHVGHDNKERQAGSIRKSQAVQGALYEIKSRQVPVVGQDGLAELILRKDNGPASREKNRTAAFITYESLPDMRIRVTFSREQDPEITDRLSEAEWEKRAATAEGKQEFVKELVRRALDARGASSATEAHVWIQQAGYRGRVGSTAVKVAMAALVDEGEIGMDASASGAGTAGGRPTDRFRALAPKPSGPHQPELGG